MIINKEEVEKAAVEYVITQRIKEDHQWAEFAQKDFKAGTNFVEEKVQEYVGDIIIENQGLKLYKDNEAERFKGLAVEFAEWIVDGGYKCPFKPGVDAYIWYYNNGNHVAKSTEELFETFIEERNETNS